jgi:MFS family permease
VALGVALGIFGLGFGITQPLSMVMVADLTRPENAGIAMGLRFTALTFANLVGPLLLGLVVEGAGLAAAFYAPAIVVGLTGLYLLALRPQLLPGRREEPIQSS